MKKLMVKYSKCRPFRKFRPETGATGPPETGAGAATPPETGAAPGPPAESAAVPTAVPAAHPSLRQTVGGAGSRWKVDSKLSKWGVGSATPEYCKRGEVGAIPKNYASMG